MKKPISEREQKLNNVMVHGLIEMVHRTDGERGSVSEKNMENSTTTKEIADKLGLDPQCITEVIIIPHPTRDDI